MSNQPDKSQHRASFRVIDVASVSPTGRRVRVYVEVSPSRWGYLSSVITLLVEGDQGVEQEIRKAVCSKIYRETGLTYLPDELQTLDVETPSAPDSAEEADASLEETADQLAEIAVAAAPEGGKRKRKAKK